MCLAAQLKEQKRNVLFLEAASLSQTPASMAIQKLICHALPTRKQSLASNPSEPPPTTIIVDDIDSDWESPDKWDKIRCMIKAFAKQSRMYKRFNMLLLCSEPECAKQIINWDSTRIRLTSDDGMWHLEHVEALRKMYPRAQGEGDRLGLCVQAGTPGFVIWSARATIPEMRAEARKRADEWALGRGLLCCVE